jgi:hypothetical protein
MLLASSERALIAYERRGSRLSQLPSPTEEAAGSLLARERRQATRLGPPLPSALAARIVERLKHPDDHQDES